MPQYPPRTQLVTVDPVIRSSYDARGRAGGPAEALTSLSTRAGGRMTPDAAAALLALHNALATRGVELRITDCFRSVAEQIGYRRRYDAWLSAGKPKPGTPAYNPATMKHDYVARPGRSNHNAGRAIDAQTSASRFPGVPADRQLDTFWGVAIPLGWTPILKAPTEGASESWHFDFWGPWRPVRDRLGYEQAAIAGALDVGQDEAFAQSAIARRVQANLHRAGFDCGDIDGIVGSNTANALTACGWTTKTPNLESALRHVEGLPDSAVKRWP